MDKFYERVVASVIERNKEGISPNTLRLGRKDYSEMLESVRSNHLVDAGVGDLGSTYDRLSVERVDADDYFEVSRRP